ncbi:MAG: hypothetical protein U1E38_01665 [Rhodospirillales bacterium]
MEKMFPCIQTSGTLSTGWRPITACRLPALQKAGLDATTFSKTSGKPATARRWPSTESVAKILTATGASLNEFIAHIGGSGGGGYQNIPVIGYAQAGTEGYFDDAGYPSGSGWDEIPFLNVGDGMPTRWKSAATAWNRYTVTAM